MTTRTRKSGDMSTDVETITYIEQPRPRSVHEALSNVMSDVRSLGKNERNPQQGFAFRGVDSVLNAVGPAFREHGIVPVPSVQSVEYTTVEIGQNRRPTGFARVVVQYALVGPDGSRLEGSAPGEGMDYGDKALPKAMSVAYRTFLIQLLCLPTADAHPEPDSEVFERSSSEAGTVNMNSRNAPPRRQEEDPDVLLARQELEEKMRTQKLGPGEVLKLYKVDNGPGADPRTETNAQRLRSFTERLAP